MVNLYILKGLGALNVTSAESARELSARWAGRVNHAL
jgi:hypothetical protein